MSEIQENAARSSHGRKRDDFVKRMIDITGAGIGLVVLLPVMLAISLLIWARLGRPVLFIQERPGRGGRPFRMVKFRTMLDATDGNGQLLGDAERLIPLGRKLRSTSLDELPELWNVLRGEMSLVGPRPLLMRYMPLYSAEQARRHEVRPGITGWAQVSGRNALSWEDKFALDVWYVDNRSLLVDARILVRTISSVIHRDGISGHGEATMAPFRGS